ncbi:MAG: substrate-binding domain-containing protein [Ignavibacteriales bacterium]|nr:substrate-binding domain-containing protein [Ignavibacteriales bacterium]
MLFRSQRFFTLLLAVAIVSITGCPTEKRETPTRGNLRVLISESVAPSLIEEINFFHSYYRTNGANITFDIVSSEEANRRFASDSTRMIITTIPFSPKVKEQVRQQFGAIHGLVIAWDGLAVIVNSANPVTQLTTTDVAAMLSGAVKNWSSFTASKRHRGIIELFLQDSSDAWFLAQRRILLGENVKAFRWNRTGSSLETIRRISQNSFGIGLVGVDWIDSAKTNVRVLELASTHDQQDTVYVEKPEARGKFFSPHPAHVYRSYYPLRRAVIAYTKTERADLASGFLSFIASAEGQKVFLRRGLVPATQPIRLK